MGPLELIREASKKQVLFTLHVHRQIDARNITIKEIFEALESPELVEDYPNDPRGHSCLILGFTKQGKPLHMVCAPRAGGLMVITVYQPSLLEWKLNYKSRRMA